MTPEQMRESGWLQLIEATSIIPSGTDFTCSISEGSLIDYWIVSVQIQAILENPRKVSAPWPPHSAIAIDVAAHPADIQW